RQRCEQNTAARFQSSTSFVFFKQKTAYEIPKADSDKQKRLSAGFNLEATSRLSSAATSTSCQTQKASKTLRQPDLPILLTLTTFLRPVIAWPGRGTRTISSFSQTTSLPLPTLPLRILRFRISKFLIIYLCCSQLATKVTHGDTSFPSCGYRYTNNATCPSHFYVDFLPE